MFEPYEHHCIFEFQNLRALNDAMNNAEFNAYIKVPNIIINYICIHLANCCCLSTHPYRLLKLFGSRFIDQIIGCTKGAILKGYS